MEANSLAPVTSKTPVVCADWPSVAPSQLSLGTSQAARKAGRLADCMKEA